MIEHENCEKCELKESCWFDKPAFPIFKQIVSIPESAYQSMQGKLFIGRTDLIVFESCEYGWGGLVNPRDSRVNLFINAFTISNFSESPVIGEVWFNTDMPECSRNSDKISPENTALCPLPEPRAKLKYASCVKERPKGGVNPFLRIAGPLSTIKAEQNGTQIIPPGGSYVIILKPLEPYDCRATAKLVFDWWEDRIC